MNDLDESTRALLLRHARNAIYAHLNNDDPPHMDGAWPELPRCGAFVTLRKAGHLRGCIGVFSTSDDLPTTIAKMATAAAQDPRFADLPLTHHELNDLRIEISLLSPLKRVEDPLSIELGHHGVYIKQGMRVGCFLPDVATERGWDRETFLTQCCDQKAGLDGMAWKDPYTEVYVFTVQKLAE